ncbi:MAG: GntR family transcriptional regulator [Propionicimonas sp.]|nr:GntR family transcriptional regulator [Propionicimonas sp.]
MPRRINVVDDVRAKIVSLIVEGTFPVGTALPNEQEMSERFEVSRATVREAYRGLIDAGVLTRSRGVGTFVTGVPHRHSLDLNLSYTEMIRDAGFAPSAKVLAISVREADDHEREALKLERGAEVLAVERIRLADETPVVYSQDRIPYSLIPSGELTGPFGSLFTYLRSMGFDARTARTRLLPVLAEGAVAKHLQVDPGTPLLFFDELDFDQTGRPIIISYEWHASNVFELWINRRAP